MYLENTELANIINAIKRLDMGPDKSLLLLFAENEKEIIPALIEQLNKMDLAFFGGIFPNLIHGTEKKEKGLLLKVIPTITEPILIKDIHQDNIQLPEILNQLPKDNKQLSALLFVDGLAPNISIFLERLYNHLGNSFKYIGGGAGSLSLEQQPCLFNKDGFFENAAILCPSSLQANIGIQHGWETIYGPMIATKTDKNTVIELNWQKAFDIYKEVIAQHDERKFEDDNFFDIAKGYPFGMFKENAEAVVRDPISVNEEGHLICVGEVPENSILHILKGQKDNLINAASLAAKKCQPDMINNPFQPIVFDCISRVLFLEDNFSEELQAIKKELPSENDTIGALTLGEIASHGHGYIEFFNKTIVVGLLH